MNPVIVRVVKMSPANTDPMMSSTIRFEGSTSSIFFSDSLPSLFTAESLGDSGSDLELGEYGLRMEDFVLPGRPGQIEVIPEWELPIGGPIENEVEDATALISKTVIDLLIGHGRATIIFEELTFGQNSTIRMVRKRIQDSVSMEDIEKGWPRLHVQTKVDYNRLFKPELFAKLVGLVEQLSTGQPVYYTDLAHYMNLLHTRSQGGTGMGIMDTTSSYTMSEFLTNKNPWVSQVNLWQSMLFKGSDFLRYDSFLCWGYPAPNELVVMHFTERATADGADLVTAVHLTSTLGYDPSLKDRVQRFSQLLVHTRNLILQKCSGTALTMSLISVPTPMARIEFKGLVVSQILATGRHPQECNNLLQEANESWWVNEEKHITAEILAQSMCRTVDDVLKNF